MAKYLVIYQHENNPEVDVADCDVYEMTEDEKDELIQQWCDMGDTPPLVFKVSMIKKAIAQKALSGKEELLKNT